MSGSKITRLLQIMSQLRDREHGCPWDLEQDFQSIAPYTLEEAYEVVDAIESADRDALREELGDLLFQVVFHAQMATEQGWFDFEDIVTGICDKMERRHPHVFADAVVENVDEQNVEWERHKQREKPHRESAMDGVPAGLPALTRAYKLQLRAARVGFDWPSIDGVFDKLDEEIGEVRQELAATDNDDAVRGECGDVLFAAVNLVRHAGMDPESALRTTNGKFVERFRRVEMLCRQDGVDIARADVTTLERYWQVAKRMPGSSRAG